MTIPRPNALRGRLPRLIAGIMFGLLAVAAACQPGPTPSETPTVIPTPVYTPIPTVTPTPLPPPPPTPTPTRTPRPAVLPATPTPTPPTPTPAPTPTPTPRPILTAREIEDELGPAVVRINASADQGSGFLFDDRGFILTNAHVVGLDDSVTVTIPGLGARQAAVVGRDQFTDVAVLRIDFLGDITSLDFADPPTAITGNSVAALGYAGGIFSSATPLLIQGRIVAQQSRDGVFYIQTDAVVDKDVTGGPLLTFRGKVVGMMTRRIAEILGQDIQGIGMAISAQSIIERLDRLMRGAQYYKPTSSVDFFPPGSTPPVQPFSQLYSGAVTINGAPAPVGLQVYARIGRYISQPVTIGVDGTYPFLTVAPPTEDGYTGERITFYVDGFPAQETAFYQSDINNPIRALSLTVTIPSAP